ncbi:MAG: radical SAM protein [Desulfurococcales archaeon]|nr:radical SAM protein [Desulfurococcales archaeon]
MSTYKLRSVKKVDAGEANIKKILPPPSRVVRENGNVYIEIADRKIGVGGPVPPLREGEKHLKITTSICPVCYRLLPARVFERDGKVYIRKVCPEHGETEELYFGDAQLYHRFFKYEETGKGIKHPYNGVGAPCPFTCGLCAMHENHTALANLVVTNKCNLSCWYCFYYAEKAGYVYEPSMEQIRFMIQRYKLQGVTMAVQITGGEPTMRDDLVDIIKMLKEEGVRHIQLNTNGIKFAELYFQDPEKAIEYSRALRQAGVNTVYMSFDGVTPKTNWKNHWEIPFIFEVFRKSGMTSVVLVPTLIKSVNDHEMGAMIKFAGKHLDIVRAVNFQPVSLTGQMKKHEREKLRITIADAITKIEEQTEGMIPKKAWFPIPVAAKFAKFVEALTGSEQFCMSNHPMCGAATYIFVERDDEGIPVRYIPITDFFDVEAFIEYLDEKRIDVLGATSAKLKALRMMVDLRKFVDTGNMPQGMSFSKILWNIFVKRNYEALGELHYNMLFLGMMHFMDPYNYDVTRVRRCNIHYLMPDGRIVPFCAFNVIPELYRDHVQYQYKISDREYKEMEKQGGLGPGAKYNRSKYWKIIKNHPLYRETYKGIIF